ncbi:hypothetical protein RhiirA1_505707 [Rhizophagus irregularis]|uniref:NAD(P)-binding protein n=1 Tax=Rhizophagus irregularis TaxID=588596 RepID=A0A2N0QUJ4_9GLOM|nr:hypothetical protein RhiirA1_505707 [Rhizophagus irregularis]
MPIKLEIQDLSKYVIILTGATDVSAELPGKIALTSSGANYFGEIDFDNLNLEKGNYWNFLKSYGNTKLMNIIVAKELGRLVQNDNITTYSLHPGLIQTNVSHLNSTFSNILNRLIIKISGEITVEQGAINTLYPVFSLENKETGKYYDEGIEKEPNKVANDQEVAKKLWDVSEKILKDHGMI